MTLSINKTYIKGNRLCSKIKYENGNYDMYFEVEKEYIKYLTDDNANAFLLALLPFAVKHEYDIEVNDYVSSKLYYQLTNYLLPLLCANFNKKVINIKCNLVNRIFNAKGVGASISCGVDSFYTLLKHKNCKDKTYNITHLTFFNAGSHGQYGGEEANILFKKRLKKIKEFCKLNKYNLVVVDSNIDELIMMNHEKRHTFTTLACVYALEKLFGKYYFASGLGFNGSHINESDTAYYDILNVHCLSNENINFYCSGIETTRMEKTKFISNYSETYDWLNVCVANEWNNCGRCSKCIRTMTSLEAIGKLELYKNVFNIDIFYKKRTNIYKELLIKNRDKLQHELLKEVLQECRKNNVRIPILSYFLSFIPNKENIIIFLKKVLPNKIIISLKKITKNQIEDGWTD